MVIVPKNMLLFLCLFANAGNWKRPLLQPPELEMRFQSFQLTFARSTKKS